MSALYALTTSRESDVVLRRRSARSLLGRRRVDVVYFAQPRPVHLKVLVLAGLGQLQSRDDLYRRPVNAHKTLGEEK